MNVGLNTFQNSESDYSSGTSDSDPDSPPSPAERDNSYTSDSEPSSSSTSSSSSCKVRNQMISKRSVSGLSKQYTFITVSLINRDANWGEKVKFETGHIYYGDAYK